MFRSLRGGKSSKCIACWALVSQSGHKEYLKGAVVSVPGSAQLDLKAAISKPSCQCVRATQPLCMWGVGMHSSTVEVQSV